MHDDKNCKIPGASPPLIVKSLLSNLYLPNNKFYTAQTLP